MDKDALTVINWIEDNLPPLSWNVIKVHNMKILMANDVRPSKIEDDTMFSPEVLRAIGAYIEDNYDTKFPFLT